MTRFVHISFGKDLSQFGLWDHILEIIDQYIRRNYYAIKIIAKLTNKTAEKHCRNMENTVVFDYTKPVMMLFILKKSYLFFSCTEAFCGFKIRELNDFLNKTKNDQRENVAQIDSICVHMN